MKPSITFVLLFIAALARPTVAEEPKAPDPEKPPIFSGLRRRSPGFKDKNADDARRFDRAKGERMPSSSNGCRPPGS
jgi:hypothetical protein